MVGVRPFRGIRNSPTLARDLSEEVCPPFDSIRWCFWTAMWGRCRLGYLIPRRRQMNMTGTENLGDRRFSAEPIYLSDLSACRPASALSSETRRGHWRMAPYEADALSGVMLVAGAEAAAPEVTCPLRLSGWHAVSFGVVGGWSEPNQILVRLSGDDTFTNIMVQRHKTIRSTTSTRSCVVQRGTASHPRAYLTRSPRPRGLFSHSCARSPACFP